MDLLDSLQLTAVFVVKLFGDLFGVMLGGGSFFVQPGLMAVGVPVDRAIANDLMAACAAMLSFLWFYRKAPVDISVRGQKAVFVWMAPVMVVSAVIGGHIMHALPVSFLKLVITTICGIGFVYSLILSLRHKGKPVEQNFDYAGENFIKGWRIFLVLAAVVIGVYDGISGAGSGVMILLLLTMVLRLRLKSAVPLANMVGGVSLLAAGITFLFLGLLSWQLLIVMLPASVLAGALGAFIVSRIDEYILRVVYTCMLGFLCVYLVREQLLM